MGATEKKQPRAGKLLMNLSDHHSLYWIWGGISLGVPVGMIIVPDWSLSSVLTLSVWFILVSTSMVCMYITKTRDMRGISLKTFKLLLIGAVMRLTCTVYLNGYIPSDSSGDYLYQLFDVLVAMCCLYIIGMAMGSLRWTYYEEYDSFPFNLAVWLVFIFASVTHPNLNGRPLFDTLWSVSLYMDSLAAAPQILMLMKSHSPVPACSCHFLFGFTLSRLMSLCFWGHGYLELTYSSFCYAGEICVIIHVLSMIMVSDFVYHYIIAMKNHLVNGHFNGAIQNLMV